MRLALHSGKVHARILPIIGSYWHFQSLIMLWNKDIADIRGHMISIND